ncbi:DUF4238 domain-containing protein [Stenotrophomonas sp. PS02301]|uniref:DUF4238 domain-containing protein n=1 Tax=Stenotrophomonas sp. PS02301 TaxID=2991427 RepID=UPI002499C841|nr:DUF4238 domain-containing protein [Stenotrophomonas sp. PS02301]
MESVQDNPTEVSTASPPLLKGPKRQHYLPRFYLRGFAGADECVAVYDRQNGALRRQKPESTAVVGHFYTMVDPDGRQRFELERALSEIESVGAEVIPRLIAGEPLQDEQRQSFALFIAVMAVRTPWMIENVKRMEAQLVEHLTLMMFGDAERGAQALRDFKGQDASEAEIRAEAEGIAALVTGGGLRASIDHQHAVTQAMPQALSLAPIFAQRDWSVLKTPARHSLVTTDAPVIVVPDGHTPRHLGPIGFGSPGTRTFFPLDASHLLVMDGNDARLGHGLFRSEVIRYVNRQLAARCVRYVIGRDDPMVSSISRASGLIAGSTPEPAFVIH